MQLIGEILEFKGRAVPEFLKVRKFFTRRKREREETASTLKEVQKLLGEVNNHYSDDNITKRDSWMKCIPVSREEYNRIFKMYEKYEKFLEEHDMTNGEIDIMYGVIKESYEERMKNRLFTEDMHGHDSGII